MAERSPGDLFQSFISSLNELTQASMSSVNRGLESVLERFKSFNANGEYTAKEKYNFSDANKTNLDVSNFNNFFREISKGAEKMTAFTASLSRVNQLFDNIKPATEGSPSYVYRYNYMSELVTMRRGFWDFLRKENLYNEGSSAVYHVPEAQVARTLQSAAKEFEDVFKSTAIKRGGYMGTEGMAAVNEEVKSRGHNVILNSDFLDNLENMLRETWRPLSHYMNLTGDIVQSQTMRYATTSIIQGLTAKGGALEGQDVSKLTTEIDRSFGDVLTDRMQKLNAIASNVVGQYTSAYTNIISAPAVSPTNFSRMFNKKSFVSLEEMGEYGVDIQSTLQRLEHLRVFPNLKDELERYVTGVARSHLVGTAFELANKEEIVKSNPKLKTAADTVSELFVSQQKEQQRSQNLHSAMLETDAQIRTLTTLDSLARNRHWEQFAQLRDATTLRKYNTITGTVDYQYTLDQSIKSAKGTPEELAKNVNVQSLSKDINNIIQNMQTTLSSLKRATEASKRSAIDLQSELDQKMESLAKETRRIDTSKLSPEERSKYNEVISGTDEIIRKVNIMTGKAEPSFVERVNTGIIRPVTRASESFLGMNMRSFEMALMFGFSSSIFDALTRVPMESTYQTIQPVFGALGNLTGITPFWHEFESFAQTAPAVMNDLQSRLNTIHSLLGSEGAARQAVGKAIDIARTQPVQFPEAMEVLTALSVYPSTRFRATNPEFQQQAFNSVQLLSMLAPEQGVGGALFAIREMLGGQFRSLQLRFNIGPETLASFAGKSLAEFKGAPGAEKLEVLNKALENMFGGQEVLFRKGAQFDVQLKNISDTLVQAIVLPMVTQTQSQFSSVIDNLLAKKVTTTKTGEEKLEKFTKPPTTINEFQQAALFTLMSESQKNMLFGVAEQRAYAGLKPNEQALLTQFAKDQLKTTGTPTIREQISTLMTSKSLTPELEAIRRTLERNSIQSASTLAIQTYGTTAGFLGLIATTINNVLQPLVQSFGIATGITNLIAPFGQKTISLTQQTQSRLSVASTDAERRKIAVDFLHGFVGDIMDAVNQLKGSISSSGVSQIFKEIANGIREISMVTFSPIAEAMVTQTAKTALNLPGQFLGSTAEQFMLGMFHPAYNERNQFSILSTMGTLSGLGTWGSLFMMERLGIGKTGAAALGTSLLQSGFVHMQGGQTSRGIMDIIMGAAPLALLRPKWSTGLFSTLYGTSVTRMNPYEILAGGETAAKVTGVIPKIEAKIAGSSVGKISQAIEEGLSKTPLGYLGSESVGMFGTSPNERKIQLVLGGLGLGLGAYEGMKAITGHTSHPALSAVSGGLESIGSMGVLFGPGPVTKSVGAIMLALGTMLDVIKSIMGSKETTKEQENNVKAEYVRFKEGVGAALSEKRVYYSNIFRQDMVAYGLKSEYKTSSGQIVDMGKFQEKYVSSMSYETAGMVKLSNILMNYVEKGAKSGEISGSGLERLASYIGAKAVEGKTGEERDMAMSNASKGLATFITSNWTLAQQYATSKDTLAKHDIEKTLEGRIKTYVAKNAPEYTENKNYINAIKRALLDVATKISESGKQAREAVKPIWRETVGREVITQTIKKNIYTEGLPPPHEINFNSMQSKEVKEQTQELVVGAMQSFKMAGSFASRTLDQAMAYGIINPREAMGMKSAMYGTLVDMVLSHKLSASKVISSPFFSEMASYAMLSGKWEQVRKSLNTDIKAEFMGKAGLATKYSEALAKTPELNIPVARINAAVNALADALVQGAQKMQEAVKQFQSSALLKELTPGAGREKEDLVKSKTNEPITKTKLELNKQMTPATEIVQRTLKSQGENSEKKVPVTDEAVAKSNPPTTMDYFATASGYPIASNGKNLPVAKDDSAKEAQTLKPTDIYKAGDRISKSIDNLSKGSLDNNTAETNSNILTALGKRVSDFFVEPASAGTLKENIGNQQPLSHQIANVVSNKITQERSMQEPLTTARLRQYDKNQPGELPASYYQQFLSPKEEQGTGDLRAFEGNQFQETILNRVFSGISPKTFNSTQGMIQALTSKYGEYGKYDPLGISKMLYKEASPTEKLTMLVNRAYDTEKHNYMVENSMEPSKAPLITNANIKEFGAGNVSSFSNIGGGVFSKELPHVPVLNGLLPGLNKAEKAGFEKLAAVSTTEPSTPLWNPETFAEKMGAVDKETKIAQLTVGTVKAFNTVLN